MVATAHACCSSSLAALLSPTLAWVHSSHAACHPLHTPAQQAAVRRDAQQQRVMLSKGCSRGHPGHPLTAFVVHC